MKMILILLALLAPFDARWDSANSATLTWRATGRSCLYVEHRTGERSFIQCWEAPGRYKITLGAVGPVSGNVRPTGGDVYTLTNGGSTVLGTAPLVGRPQYFPAFLH